MLLEKLLENVHEYDFQRFSLDDAGLVVAIAIKITSNAPSMNGKVVGLPWLYFICTAAISF
jgi:hypothetical protein